MQVLTLKLPAECSKVFVSICADLFQRFQDLGVFGLKTAVLGDILRRIFTQEDQRISDVIGLINCARDLLYHPLLCFDANAGRGFRLA